MYSLLGPVAVECAVDKNITTTWPFSTHQQEKNMYKLAGGYVSNALWIELSNSKFQTISYKAHIQQKAMISKSTACVQYIRPCDYFMNSNDFNLEWSNGNGQIYSMNFNTTYGCHAICLEFG